MAEFELVATGGTFDILHSGHKTLLSRAFEVSSKVIIGLTSDELAKQRGKTPLNSYRHRLDALTLDLMKNFAGRPFRISRLDSNFGPAVLEEGVQALVVSEETRGQGDVLNWLRAEKNLPPVKIVPVPMVLAEDGMRISTTRIKNSEIDAEGNLLSVDK